MKMVNSFIHHCAHQVSPIITMISIRLIISLCFVIVSKTKGINVPAEDLVDEYYTTIMKPNDNYLPQDEKDAQSIMDSDRKEDVIAGILCYREKIRRFAINQRMLTKIQPIHSTYSSHSSHSTYYWINEYYVPQRTGNSTRQFMDLCFGLLEDENVVLGQYLRNFFAGQDETWIIIGMVLTKDMGAMITTYDTNHGKGAFKDERKSQRHPFENMLRVWVRHNRDSIETTEPNPDDVKNDANILKKECESGDWHEKNRDQLELILMKKSIKYARAVLAEFETAMGNKTIESILNENVHDGFKINHDLADAYSSLARYIKNKYSYIADILGTYSTDSDQWAAWILCIAVVHPEEWTKVDQAFQAKNNKQTLSSFITQKLTADKVMAEMIAVIVDSKFKPTSFSGNPAQGGSLPIQTPPPVAPTVPAAAPGSV